VQTKNKKQVKRVQKRVFWALLVLVFCFLMLVLTSSFTSRPFVRTLFEDEFSELLGSRVTFDTLDFDLFPARVVLSQVRLHELKGSFKHVDIEGIEASIQLRPLLFGKVVIPSATITKPTIAISLGDAPKKKRPPLDLSWNESNKLEIQDMQVDEAQLRIEFGDASVASLQSNALKLKQDGNTYWLKTSWQGSLKHQEVIHPLEEISIELSKVRDRIKLESFELSDPSGMLVGEGSIWPKVEVDFVYKNDLKSLAKVLSDFAWIKKDIEAEGALDVTTHFTGTVNHIEAVHDVTIKNFLMHDRKLDKIDAQVHMSQGTLSKAYLQGYYKGQKIKLDVNSSKKKGTFSYLLRSENLSFVDVQKWIDPNQNPIAFSNIDVSSRGRLTLDPVAVQGDLEVVFPKVEFDIPKKVSVFMPLEIKAAVGKAKLSLDNKGFSLLEGKLISEQLDGEFGILVPFGQELTAFWNVDVQDAKGLFQSGYPAQGKGVVSGKVEAPRGQTRIGFILDFPKFKYDQYGLHHFKGEVVFAQRQVRLKRLQMINQSKGMLEINGAIETERESFEITGTYQDFDLAWFGAMVGRRYENVQHVEGLGSGSLLLKGKTDTLDGYITTKTGAAKVMGVPVDGIDTKVVFQKDTILFDRASIKGSVLSADFKGQVRDQVFDKCHIHFERVPLQRLISSSALSFLGNTISADMHLDGPFDNPHIDIQAELFDKDQDGMFTKTVVGAATGLKKDLGWRLKTVTPGFFAKGRVYIEAQNRFSFEADLDDLEMLKKLEGVKTKITGQVKGSGVIEDDATWNMTASIDNYGMHGEEIAFFNKEKIVLEMINGEMNIDKARFGTQAYDVNLSGMLGRKQSLDIRAQGFLPLKMLTLLPLGLVRVEGDVELDLRLSGNMAEPIWGGAFVLQGGYIRQESFPHPFEAIEVQGEVNQNQLQAKYIEAQLGSGQVTAEGNIFLATNVDDIRLFFSGDIDQVNLRFPDYMPVEVRGPFSVEGPASKPLLKTDFEVIKGLYTYDWDWQSQVLTFGQEEEAQRIYREEEEAFELDMHFYSTNGDFLVRNDVALAKVKGDLYVRGTDRAFGILGTVELMEGQVTFLENRFDLLPGLVSFISEDEIEMSFNLTAKTRVSNTDILLDIITEQNNIRAYLSSVPQKEETTLISLLTLGVELDDLAVSSGLTEGVSASIIPRVLSGPLQSRLQSGLKKIRLVDSFQFIPYFSEDTKTTGLKLFVAKNLFSKVRLTYSTDMFEAGNENIFTLQQFINDDFSLLGSFRDNSDESDQDVDLGLDVEFRKEF